MSGLFEFAAGSITGRSHRIAGRNNQDAYCLLQTPECSVAIVCDGCGSGEQSEVGAKIAAPLVARAVLRNAQGQVDLAQAHQPDASERPIPYALWEEVRLKVLEALRTLAGGMGDSLFCVVNDYFLFTVVGALITPASSMFFAIGDGVLVVNDEVIRLGPFPDNAPPYLAYGLVDSSLEYSEPRLLHFQIHRTLPTSELHSFLIGTDGVEELMKARGRTLPGKTEVVGPLSRFWREDRYFANPDMIRRQLAGVNRDVVALTSTGLHKAAGLLYDDTTLIVGRRRSMEEAGGTP